MVVMKRLKQQAPEQEAIRPIAENAEYRAIGLKVQELERLQSEKLVHREALQDQRRQLRPSSFVDFLTTKFLSGDSEPSEASLRPSRRRWDRRSRPDGSSGDLSEKRRSYADAQ